MKKYILGDTLKKSIEILQKDGAKLKIYHDPNGRPFYIISKPGYKTLVFKYEGIEPDGSNIYSMRQYNKTPKKYA